MTSEFKPGDKVRLTGDEWGSQEGFPKKGEVVTIFEVFGGEPTFRSGNGIWSIYEGYEAVLVSDEEELSLPRGDYHPNFVQVYLEPDDSGGWVEALSAYRDSVGEAWQLSEMFVHNQDDIDLLRLLLDEIETRLIEEESE